MLTSPVPFFPFAMQLYLFAESTDSSPASGWIVFLIATVIGAAIMYGINILQGRDAKNQSKRLLEQTKLDCENLVKSGELEKKEKLLQQQSRFDSENQKVKDELRKRESTLERKEEQLKQSSD
ncbi:MAG TPA: Rnase Y domain-containing protein, partial [Pirellula sp.]|nr:Rnase Y domain-containing protein [Pirellula sp.]